MNLLTLVRMAAAGMPDRVAVGPLPECGQARAGASLVRDCAAEEIVYLGVNGQAFPLALLSGAWAGVPVIPLNYRLGPDQLAGLLARHPRALIISDLTRRTGARVISTRQWRSACARPAPGMPPWQDDPEAVAAVLYTRG